LAAKALVEDTPRQLTEFFFFQSAQIAGADFGGYGNFFERNAAQFTLTPQFFAKLTHVCPFAGATSFRIIGLHSVQVKRENAVKMPPVVRKARPGNQPGAKLDAFHPKLVFPGPCRRVACSATGTL
jgi:hypothetical protein